MDETTKRSNTSTIVIVVVAALALTCVACVCVLAPFVARGVSQAARLTPWRTEGGWQLGQVEASRQISQRFDVAGPLALDLQLNVGDVRIEEGSEGQVEIQGTAYAWGSDRAAAEARLQEYKITLEQPNSGRIVIRSEGNWSGQARTPKADLVITLPRRADVRASVGVGNLRLADVEGKLDLQVNVGDLQARRITPTASSNLTTNVGTLTVQLPHSAALRLDARTNVGSVRCEPDLQDVETDSSLVGKSLRGRLGDDPTITLTLRVNTGDIHVEQGW